MSEMIEVKTSALEGASLDWAVSRVEGVEFEYIESMTPFFSGGMRWRKWTYRPAFSPSTDWSQGGPLIEKLLATGKWEVVQGAKDGTVWVQNYDKDCVPVDGESWDQRNMYFESESLLIAACRAIVAAKLGDTISVPAELLNHG